MFCSAAMMLGQARRAGSRFLGQLQPWKSCGESLRPTGLESSCHDVGSVASRLQATRGMIQLRTDLDVADNSGAKRVQCIKVLRGSKYNCAKIGDVIVASVKDAMPRGKVAKGEVVKGVVVRTRSPRTRLDGTVIRFDTNSIVLIQKTGEPIGTRVMGPVPHDLRRKNHAKLLSMAKHVQ